jgi:large conductance mechanosensitive channel
MASGNGGRRVRARTRSFWDDFKNFALKGNVVDLAVAVIIGGAFGAVIKSLIEDIIMPAILNPLLAQTGTNWQEAVIGPGIRLGSFLSTIINFLVIAFVLYLIVRTFEKAKLKEAADAEPPVEEKLNDTLNRLTDFLESQSRR